MEETMYETAQMWRYYVGAVKVLVPEGRKVVVSDDGTTFQLEGFWGHFNVAAIPSLLEKGWLRQSK